MMDGPFAWIMIVVALLLIFGGGKRLPEIGRGLGSFVREFKRAQKDDAPSAEAPKVLDAAEVAPKLKDAENETKS